MKEEKQVVHVKVTQEHIDKGESGVTCCPIALAVSEVLGWRTSWGYEEGHTNKPSYKMLYSLSPRLTHEFVDTFDGKGGEANRDKVRPIEFDLEITDIVD